MYAMLQEKNKKIFQLSKIKKVGIGMSIFRNYITNLQVVKGEFKLSENESPFETLFKVNVNEHIEKKEKTGIAYLSWTYAWAEVKKRYPNANYEVHLFGEKQLPYVFDEDVGYMVFTSVTIEGLTHTMWLPVMDAKNKPMKSEAYTYDTKYETNKKVEAATMTDINKAIMRCLVKNLAMFGLGLYVYSGEDLPEIETEKISRRDAVILKGMIKDEELQKKIFKKYGIRKFDELTVKQHLEIMQYINSKEGKEEGSK